MDHFGFDDAAIRLCHQGQIDALSDFNIYASDLDNIRAPLRPRSMYATPVDYEKYQPNFCYMPIQRVIDTFKHTTQNMVLPPSSFLRRRFKSFWPFMNFPRRVEYDSTDLIYSNVKCHTTGVELAHLFTGSVSKVMDAFGVKDGSSAEFLSSFQERVVKRGVPTKLVADNAPLYRSKSIARYLLELMI